MRRHRLTIVADPRFPGGTSAAVAAEIMALAGSYDLSFVALETAMFKGRSANPVIEAALDAVSLDIVWDPRVIHADTIVFHNPSCLRFNSSLSTRMSCAEAFVVTHENFLRPGRSEGFDVAGCLGLIANALVCGARWLAPVSSYNRETVLEWLARGSDGWVCAPGDWFNICDAPLTPPVPRPRDRRGRHSRPGPEKFPPLETMLAHFPARADCNIILGADALIAGGDAFPPNWDLRRFGATDVRRFLSEIDFFVYFTHPLWRESFGRVIVEAIAAGKAVITDPGTAQTFGDAVIGTDGHDIDEIVSAFLDDPQRYSDFVRSAQATLARFSAEAFRSEVGAMIAPGRVTRHVVV